jgi:hypothetical protein
MALLPRFDSPAFLSDFDAIPGQRDAWHQFVSRAFDASIASEASKVKSARRHGKGVVQFFNPSTYDPGGALIEQPVTWNAFPKELLRRFGRKRALVEADRLWPLSVYHFPYDPDVPTNTGAKETHTTDSWFYRPTVEYCEWHVTRDPNDGKIRRVVLTSEPPEYWQALFGDAVDPGDGTPVPFPGDRQLALKLYRELVSPHVELEDLIVPEAFTGGGGELYKKGVYNPYNKWNTFFGAVHLNAPPNQLTAEIQLGADGTILRRDARGELIVQPDALIACSGYGGANRNSDPTIGATVNALARLGAMVTLVNPVGLYMDHIDLSGWSVPDGIAASDCVKIARGTERMIERLVIEVPRETGVTLGDVTIGGEPIVFGGQIAECVTVKLVGGAGAIGSVKNAPVACQYRGYLDPHDAREIALEKSSQVAPIGYAEAFVLEGGWSEEGPPEASPAGSRRPLRGGA